MLGGGVMSTRFKIFAVAAALATRMSSAAMAEYPCVPGYAWRWLSADRSAGIFEPGIRRRVR
jgi:hypothetical protein